VGFISRIVTVSLTERRDTDRIRFGHYPPHRSDRRFRWRRTGEYVEHVCLWASSGYWWHDSHKQDPIECAAAESRRGGGAAPDLEPAGEWVRALRALFRVRTLIVGEAVGKRRAAERDGGRIRFLSGSPRQERQSIRVQRRQRSEKKWGTPSPETQGPRPGSPDSA